ncbi:MAG: YkgJ family cysteine cluster protein [Burkholderiales bacterium]
MIDEKKAAANRAARMAKKQAHLRAVYDRHVEKLRVLAGQDSLSIARDSHAAIDGYLARDLEQNPPLENIRCARGCSHCCHGPVEIAAHEAALLIDVVRASGRPLDRDRLQRQGRYAVDTWREQAPADRACVFLGGDGACTVYESRPAACRKLLVTSPPEFCDAGKNSTHRIDRWFSWEAEMMASAALEVFGLDLMPRALLAAARGKNAAE